MEKRILVIILNYNGLNDTIECVNSLLQSNQNDIIDILIIDNGSRIDECSVLNEMFPFVKTIRFNEGVGFSGGCNFGFRFAKEKGYEYVLILGNDTIIEKDMICKLLEADNGKSLCVPKMYYYDDPQVIWCGGGWISRAKGNGYNKDTGRKDMNSKSIEAPQKCTFGNGTCMLISTSIFDIVGLFDEDFFIYYEDTDFCLRSIKNGVDIIYVPNAKIWHKVSKSTGGDESFLSVYYTTRNRLLFIHKHRDYFTPLAVLYTLITRAIRISQYMLAGKSQWKPIVKGIRDYYSGVRGRVDKYV